MTFLELVRKVARESGTVPGGEKPTSVIGAADREGLCVGWVRDAWISIQNSRTDWLWMQRAFSVPVVAGVASYSSADLALPRVAQWLAAEHWTVEADGTETPVRFVDWRTLDALRTGAGVTVESRPWQWGMDPQRRIVLYPTPDRAYQLRGVYRLTPQRMLVDAEVPEMPEEHHDLIWQTALVTLALYDEAAFQSQAWEAMRRRSFVRLVNDQTPLVS